MLTGYEFILYRPGKGDAINLINRIEVENCFRALGLVQENPYRWVFREGRTVLYLDLEREDPMKSIALQIPFNNPLASFRRAMALCRSLKERLSLQTRDLQLGVIAGRAYTGKGFEEFRKARELTGGIVKALGKP